MSLPFFFIQARSTSTRLPGKTLMPLWQEKTILQLQIERILLNFPNYPVALLTTDNPADNQLIESIRVYPVNVFRGSEQDVLDRFLKAGDLFGATEIIRVCSDNPFLLWESLQELLVHDCNGIDYLSFSFRGKPVMKCHFGLFAERVKLDALKTAAALTRDPVYREHVTNYIYERPDRFSVCLVDKTAALAELENFRLTVDTAADFENVSVLLRQMPDPLSPRLKDIIKIKKQFPALETSMQNEIKNNSK